MKALQRAVLTLLSVIEISFPLFAQQTDERKMIVSQMEQSLKSELLTPWYPASVDKQYGGFLSAFSFDFKPTDQQDKMIVTQSRHVWTNAKASILYPNDAHFKSGAKHGYNFLKNVMWDKTNGGFHTLVDREGNVKDGGFAPKEAYGNSFALYALAAYYQATGDTTALNLAIKEFYWLEKNSYDPEHKGYFQHMSTDGTPEKRDPSSPSTSVRGYKDQNTSIHLLESFTELYMVWPDSLLRERLMEMLYLVRDRITTDKGYLTLFFQPDWTPITFRDSSEASILTHRYVDHVSFGHDVETAYLLLEASHALGFRHDEVTLKKAKLMVDHALKNGWDDNVGGFYDEGYYFKNKPEMTIIRDSKNWWAQAEALNTLLLMADHFPEDEMKYFDNFKKLWHYVRTYLIDHEHGGWYQGGLDKEPEQKKNLKGHIWKATYHQYRALANCIQRLTPDVQPPSPPVRTKWKSKKLTALSWNPATDNRKLLGYNIYCNEKRIGFTPLTEFSVIASGKDKAYTVRAIDLQGNESRSGNTMIRP